MGQQAKSVSPTEGKTTPATVSHLSVSPCDLPICLSLLSLKGLCTLKKNEDSLSLPFFVFAFDCHSVLMAFSSSVYKKGLFAPLISS